ncbi:hypothetical protein [Natrinema hispanicum]|uniref:DUF1102 domain-containing protein n=1 Tax=Natrinema hispanicum TaxID=392421 RepID=A0A1G6KVV7_9EURY|nr:hypothetical protein [Natrinema hispanicum]SDC35073.1 hypothetical protein SAMN05192552_100396 [Natrinema hispanicum]
MHWHPVQAGAGTWIKNITMRTNRKNVLISLGLIVAISGAALGSGAFTSVEADRGVSVETAGDANAYLAITPGDDYSEGEYITNDSDGTLTFDLGNGTATTGTGFNENATTTLNDLVKIENQGTSTGTVNIDVSNESDSTAGDSTTVTLDGAKVTFEVTGGDSVGEGETANITATVETDPTYSADPNTDITIHAQ